MYLRVNSVNELISKIITRIVAHRGKSRSLESFSGPGKSWNLKPVIENHGKVYYYDVDKQRK